ncbi:hypothetical protein lbkm_2614 [Lachnospiraceae bacterium KM106-2]|nr:hypothetical protein lbkm_2614 [Lachnospiraceae bacterium KM106-2]
MSREENIERQPINCIATFNLKGEAIPLVIKFLNDKGEEVTIKKVICDDWSKIHGNIRYQCHGEILGIDEEFIIVYYPEDMKWYILDKQYKEKSLDYGYLEGLSESTCKFIFYVIDEYNLNLYHSCMAVIMNVMKKKIPTLGEIKNTYYISAKKNKPYLDEHRMEVDELLELCYQRCLFKKKKGKAKHK